MFDELYRINSYHGRRWYKDDLDTYVVCSRGWLFRTPAGTEAYSIGTLPVPVSPPCWHYRCAAKIPIKILDWIRRDKRSYHVVFPWNVLDSFSLFWLLIFDILKNVILVRHSSNVFGTSSHFSCLLIKHLVLNWPLTSKRNKLSWLRNYSTSTASPTNLTAPSIKIVWHPTGYCLLSELLSHSSGF